MSVAIVVDDSFTSVNRSVAPSTQPLPDTFLQSQVLGVSVRVTAGCKDGEGADAGRKGADPQITRSFGSNKFPDELVDVASLHPPGDRCCGHL